MAEGAIKPRANVQLPCVTAAQTTVAAHQPMAPARKRTFQVGHVLDRASVVSLPDLFELSRRGVEMVVQSTDPGRADDIGHLGVGVKASLPFISHSAMASRSSRSDSARRRFTDLFWQRRAGPAPPQGS